MNRTIKFRVWDLYNKKMVEVGELDDIQVKPDLDFANYEVMQFTGLTDKNGKEIYEGDIVRDVGGFNVEVRWENGREGYVPFSIGRGERNPNDCEVIGNVFESPNLLKDKPNEN